MKRRRFAQIKRPQGRRFWANEIKRRQNPQIDVNHCPNLRNPQIYLPSFLRSIHGETTVVILSRRRGGGSKFAHEFVFSWCFQFARSSPGSDESTQHLVVKVYDDEGLQASELIRCAQVPLSELQPCRVKDVWLKLVKDLEIQRDNKNRGQNACMGPSVSKEDKIEANHRILVILDLGTSSQAVLFFFILTFKLFSPYSQLDDTNKEMDFRRRTARHIRPGPEDPSLLYLQNRHISEAVWQQHPDRVLRPRRHRALELLNPPVQIVPLLERTGFYAVSRVGYIPYDHALISALVERWRPETHSFHMPMGECTITLQDVEIQLGLPVDGWPVTGSMKYDWSELCLRLLGEAPPASKLKGSRVNMTWFDERFSQVPENATPIQLEQFARAYILRLLGCFLMPDTSGNLQSLMYLPLLENLDDVKKFSWGSAVLAYLYRSLCHATDYKEVNIGGCMHLLTVWAWDRFPLLAPRQKRPHPRRLSEEDESRDYPTMPPLSFRWSDYKELYHTKMHLLPSYRRTMDDMFYHNVVWEPYHAAVCPQQLIPAYCREGEDIWRAEVPLIHFNIIEWHQPDRVLRQFGLQQPIPNAPYDLDVQHTLKLMGKTEYNWAAEHRWYRQITRRWIDPEGAAICWASDAISEIRELVLKGGCEEDILACCDRLTKNVFTRRISLADAGNHIAGPLPTLPHPPVDYAGTGRWKPMRMSACHHMVPRYLDLEAEHADAGDEAAAGDEAVAGDEAAAGDHAVGGDQAGGGDQAATDDRATNYDRATTDDRATTGGEANAAHDPGVQQGPPDPVEFVARAGLDDLLQMAADFRDASVWTPPPPPTSQPTQDPATPQSSGSQLLIQPRGEDDDPPEEQLGRGCISASLPVLSNPFRCVFELTVDVLEGVTLQDWVSISALGLQANTPPPQQDGKDNCMQQRCCAAYKLGQRIARARDSSKNTPRAHGRTEIVGTETHHNHKSSVAIEPCTNAHPDESVDCTILARRTPCPAGFKWGHASMHGLNAQNRRWNCTSLSLSGIGRCWNEMIVPVNWYSSFTLWIIWDMGTSADRSTIPLINPAIMSESNLLWSCDTEGVAQQ
ncbi:serine/threonine-protein phosphatase 7 long form-like protein [Senna tora]|uniref:Serine/threonine-protein phosphatase 7 long form-like protein n=1 Tax=Senna tora TaxID=362788 RepID=A0A834XJU7_9FABA|nr:serine/threonine-protein phosphatase 7 long form-like protein [Senna tora]